MKKYISLLIIFGFIVSFNFAFAQNVTTSTQATLNSNGINAEAKADVEAKPTLLKETVKENIQEKKEARDMVKEQISETRTLMQEEKESAQARRAELIEQAKQIRAESKARIEAMRAEVAVEKDEAKARVRAQMVDNREAILQRFDKNLEIIERNKDKVAEILETRIAPLGLDLTSAEESLAEVEANIVLTKEGVAKISVIITTSPEEITKEQREELVVLRNEFVDLIKESNSLLRSIIKDIKEDIRNQNLKKVETTTTVNTEANTETETNDGE
jgi:F0F1-type ATP synthase membrane subunit b/b'